MNRDIDGRESTQNRIDNAVHDESISIREYVDLRLVEIVANTKDLKNDLHEAKSAIGRIETKISNVVTWRALATAVTVAAAIITMAFMLRGR